VKPATVKFANLDKQRIKVQKAYYRLDCVRKDYINKIASTLVRTNPVYITIEDLNILGIMKNKRLSKATCYIPWTTREFKPLDFCTNLSSFGERGKDEEGRMKKEKSGLLHICVGFQ
jgi:hypothetical protein